ncbi:MAG: hypothetical protein ACLT2C_05195 [Ruminococcus sp.]
MSELAGVMETFPQVLYNVTIPAAKKGHWQEDAEIAALIDTYTKELGDNGRILVRESGTEPLIRVMVEGKMPCRWRTPHRQLPHRFGFSPAHN